MATPEQVAEPEDVVETAPEPPTIVITFAGHLSADCRMSVTDCSPFQMWGAARMLEQYAEDQWQAAQMQAAMLAAKEAQNGKVTPMDHQRKKGRN